MSRAEKRLAFVLVSWPTKRRRSKRLSKAKKIVDSSGYVPKSEPPTEQQDDSPQIREEEIAQVLENMGTFFSSKENENCYRNATELVVNLTTSTHSSHNTEIPLSSPSMHS